MQGQARRLRRRRPPARPALQRDLGLGPPRLTGPRRAHALPGMEKGTPSPHSRTVHPGTQQRQGREERTGLGKATEGHHVPLREGGRHRELRRRRPRGRGHPAVDRRIRLRARPPLRQSRTQAVVDIVPDGRGHPQRPGGPPARVGVRQPVPRRPRPRRGRLARRGQRHRSAVAEGEPQGRKRQVARPVHRTGPDAHAGPRLLPVPGAQGIRPDALLDGPPSYGVPRRAVPRQQREEIHFLRRGRVPVQEGRHLTPPGGGGRAPETHHQDSAPARPDHHPARGLQKVRLLTGGDAWRSAEPLREEARHLSSHGLAVHSPGRAPDHPAADRHPRVPRTGPVHPRGRPTHVHAGCRAARQEERQRRQGDGPPRAPGGEDRPSGAHGPRTERIQPHRGEDAGGLRGTLRDGRALLQLHLRRRDIPGFVHPHRQARLEGRPRRCGGRPGKAGLRRRGR